MNSSRPPVPLLAWRPLVGILFRQIVLYRRSVPRWMEIFYWPLLDLLVWGFLTLYLKKIPSFMPSAVTSLLGALLLWDLLYRAQQGISVMFLEEIWSKNLIHLLIAPITPFHVVGGAVLSSIVKVLLSSSVAAFLAYLLFSFRIFSLGLHLFFFILALLMMGWALGILTTAVILRYGQEAEVLAWGVIFLFQPFSAVFNPVSVLPQVAADISRAVPASYVFEGMRSVLVQGRLPVGDLMMAFLLDFLYATVALFVYSRVITRARQKGFHLKLGS
ncbi:MAG: ABC transporter permease [Nitrospiraceae bacterium]|nr:ABC transporter permease [Nitrospiraceae bacterium]